MYLIIGIWGGKNRVYAAYKFFLYTLLGSLFLLIAIAWMAITAKTTSIPMGGYGFLRFSLPMFPEASNDFAPFVFALSGIAIVYTSLVAFRQTDIKKLIAYSSVAHMGFVTMGIFS
eukprot:gene35016-biopygen28616